LGAHRVAGCTEKAVKAAIAARQWQKAAHVVDLLDEKSGQEHVRALAEHYAAVHEYVSPLARHHECYTPTSLSLSSFPPCPPVPLVLFFLVFPSLSHRAQTGTSTNPSAFCHIHCKTFVDFVLPSLLPFLFHRRYKSAEKFYVRAGNPKAAIDMFIQAGMWDDAHRLSVRYMNPDDVADLYITKAEELEQSSKYVA